MSTEQPKVDKSYLWFLATGLGLYCIVLTAITGDLGFNGDDWWVLACPYWNSFPDALVLYARTFLRPVEGLYWISLFKVFGFDRVSFHLCSLVLLACSAVLMGVSLDRAFPGRWAFVSIAVLLAFFLPPVSCLTYVLFTDNSRLSMLLFWTSAIAFQRWAQKSPRWSGLALPVALYVSSFLTYESSSFLIFMVPLLVWPVHRYGSGRPGDRAFLTKLCVGIVAGFAVAVAIRFVFLNGGAVGQSFIVPPFELLWSYNALLPFYLLAPFTSMSTPRCALLAGFLVVLMSAGLFHLSGCDRPVEAMPAQGRFEPGSKWHFVALGTGILVLGMLPYQLAGYGIGSPRLVETLMVKSGLLPGGDLSWFNFTWSSRIYSSATFGVAILLAYGLSGWRQPSAKLIAKTAALVVIGFMAVFHAGLSQDWREAAEIRNDLFRSMVSQVPAVKSGTNFVFLDIACSHKRAEVIRRENGLCELLGMLYADRTLGAWRAYSCAYDPSTHVSQQAVAMPRGFLSEASQRQYEPAPPESLLLFKRSGRELLLLGRITDQDASVPTGIAWRGVKQLTSNLGRIEAWRAVISPEVNLSRNTWASGLISTLRLSWLELAPRYIRRLKYASIHNPLWRRVFKSRPHQLGARL